MIWARLDGPDTGALLPEVLVVVCSRAPRAEARDRFVVLWLLHWLERTTLISNPFLCAADFFRHTISYVV